MFVLNSITESQKKMSVNLIKGQGKYAHEIPINRTLFCDTEDLQSYSVSFMQHSVCGRSLRLILSNCVYCKDKVCFLFSSSRVTLYSVRVEEKCNVGVIIDCWSGSNDPEEQYYTGKVLCTKAHNNVPYSIWNGSRITLTFRCNGVFDAELICKGGEEVHEECRNQSFRLGS